MTRAALFTCDGDLATAHFSKDYYRTRCGLVADDANADLHAEHDLPREKRCAKCFTVYAHCHDPRHATPCPHYADTPCRACLDECDPSALQLVPFHELDDFTRAYITCALWSTNDGSDESGGCPLDDNYGPEDIAPSALAAIIRDCAAFQEAHAEDIATDPSQAGHDFWLTRNGHGAGFWDGDWPEPAATRLTKAAKACGEVWLYVGDDGRIYS